MQGFDKQSTNLHLRRRFVQTQHSAETSHHHQSPKTASSDTLLRLAVSARNFEGNGAAASHPLVSLLLVQLPRRPLAQVSIRRSCKFFAVLCNCLRRSLSSDGGKHRPLRAAGSRRERRLWHRLHCSIDLNLRARL